MKTSVGALGFAAVAAVTGCIVPVDVTIEDDDFHVRGSGRVVTEIRHVRGFDGVSAGGAAIVVIENTGRESVRVTAEDNILPYLVTDVREGLLTIGVEPGVSLSPRRDVVVHVELDALIEIEGSGAVEIEADVGQVPDLFVTLSGAATLEVWGQVEFQDVVLSGASRYRGLRLESLTAKVGTSGAASAVVSVFDRLDAHASGASSIRYAGNPTVRASTSGAASIGPY